MSLGVVMLVHDSLGRASQLARHWANNSCPVVIHVDLKVSSADHQELVDGLKDLDIVRFCTRRRCEWGNWSLVDASQTAAEMMLEKFPDVRHVLLASGSCLPLRPVADIVDYLEQRPETDFIESVTTSEVPWTMGGLNMERFTLWFPFSWRRHRRMFDRHVELQRKLGIKRRIPAGIVPHLGSQWWCLTRRTLTSILNDPARPTYDRYFKRVWIPDESYYQTLARLYSSRIESRSLTLSKFDFQGKPHIFYDDHLQLLRRSDCFVARKIWNRADKLYDSFLNSDVALGSSAEPNPAHIDRVFSSAVQRRTKGRPGLIMQSRFPRDGRGNGVSSAEYSVFEGFSDLFEDFEGWLSETCDTRVHGHLYAPEKAHFSDREEEFFGSLSSAPDLRDYNPDAFLTSLIWNTRGERQSFQFGPRDNQEITYMIAKDPNAQISVITGAWAIPLFHSNGNFTDIRRIAAKLQQIEYEHVEQLTSYWARARVRIWSLADFLNDPVPALQSVIDEIGPRSAIRLSNAPRMKSLVGFSQFLQELKNQGMLPYMVGDFSEGQDVLQVRPPAKKPYLVR